MQIFIAIYCFKKHILIYIPTFLKYPYSKISNFPGMFNKVINDSKQNSSILLKLFSKKNKDSKKLFSLTLVKGIEILQWKVRGVWTLDAENNEECIPCLVRAAQVL